MKSVVWQLKMKSQATALQSNRYGVSERATAAIASSVLEDDALITENDSCQVIDIFKILRVKSRNIYELRNQSENSSQQFHGIYFDGVKYEPLVIKTMEVR